MQIEIVSEESRFFQLESVWQYLLERNHSTTIFMTFEWLSTWWRHFGDGKRLFIVIVWDGSDAVGLAPLLIAPRDGFRELTMIGGHSVEYTDFIVADGQERQAVLSLILGALVENQTWDYCEINGLREDSPNFSCLATLLERLHAHAPLICKSNVAPYVPLDGSWQEYWLSLGKGFRRNSIRQPKRLEEAVGEISYSVPSCPDDAEAYMERLFGLHADRWSKDRNFSIFENSPTRSFYRDLAGVLFDRGWLYMPMLSAGGKVGAITFGAMFGKKYYGFISVFDAAFSSYSVGHLLYLHTLRECFIRGLQEFDFMIGDEVHKHDYNPRVIALYTLVLFQSGPRGRAARPWLRYIRPRLEEATKENSLLGGLNTWLLRSGFRKKG